MTERFVEELLKWGVATEEQVTAARRSVEKFGGIMPSRLIEAGCRSVDVLSALWAATGIPIAPASMLRDAERAKSNWGVNAHDAWKYLAVPIGLHEGELRIAYCDPVTASQSAAHGLPQHKPMLAEEVRVRAVLRAVFGPAPIAQEQSSAPASLAEALAAAGGDDGPGEPPAAAAGPPNGVGHEDTSPTGKSPTSPAFGTPAPAPRDPPAILTTQAPPSTSVTPDPQPAAPEIPAILPAVAAEPPRAEAASSSGLLWWAVAAIVILGVFLALATAQGVFSSGSGAGSGESADPRRE